MAEAATFVQFHRVEPNVRPSGTGGQLDESLEARMADPLFLMARQWQLAEFHGEDGGSPVSCRIATVGGPIERFRAADGGPPLPYPQGVPVEYLAEAGGDASSVTRELPLRAAARAGQRFLTQLGALPAAVLDAVARQALKAFPLVGDDPSPPAGTGRPEPDPAGRALGEALKARVPHGGRLSQGLLADAWHPTGLSAAHTATFKQAAVRWQSWFAAEHSPPAPPTWVRERLEHRFAVEAKLGDRRIALTAPEYPGGSADAYQFDIDTSQEQLGTLAATTPARTTLPTRATYPGMPAERWWEFEDTTVNLPAIGAGPPDLARLLVVEFANVYGNDHWVVPVELSVGQIHVVTELTVADTFGDTLAIDPVGDEHWSLFRLSVAGSGEQGPALLPLLPQAPGRIEGSPVEEVLFVRDEMANLAWAVERTVQSGTGRPRLRADEIPEEAPASPSDLPGTLAYRLLTPVPAHWIPLVPVPLMAGGAAIRFRRGRVPHFTTNGVHHPKAAGRLLEPEVRPVYFRDEEIPRSGVTVTRVPVTARGHDGQLYHWVGRRVRAGRGEATAGLAFDGVIAPKDGSP